ncbi:MAG: FAD-binding oxidoreductase, partial [Deltaproteobacteria bacterium]|nr:FAD-binding oxidoreductase [Deltaproteobacteria bacterium]
MIAKRSLELLRQKLGKKNVITEEEDLLTLGYDSTPELSGSPQVAAYPTSLDGIRAAMEVARNEGLPITPRGSGTGL